MLRREVAGLQLVAKHCDHLQVREHLHTHYMPTAYSFGSDMQTLVIPVPQKLYTRFDRDRVMPLLERLVLANRRSLRRVSGDVLHVRHRRFYLITCSARRSLSVSFVSGAIQPELHVCSNRM